MFLDSRTYLSTLKTLLENENSVDIAVAFWGEGAEALLVGQGKRRRILCNLTTGGTNPSVIKRIQNEEGIEVKHLADLHAKVVVGKNAVILGSANWSANGLSLEGNEVQGWQEAGYVITSAADIKSAKRWFSQRWKDAEDVTPQLLERACKVWKAEPVRFFVCKAYSTVRERNEICPSSKPNPRS
jgi:phosphatidylserine/phosphatidylglycerophosphate/cardiolipin synthase-like enzyme